jgi:pantetheine-phosphate adenylyltransferase
MEKKAVFPGTFDPFTMGHLDIVRRCLAIFDRLVIGVADQHHKKPLFDAATRVAMIRESLGEDLLDRVQVVVFRKLLVDFARDHGVRAIVRGLRVLSDFEYEFQMAFMNQRLAPDLETIFLAPRPRFSFVTSTLVKEVASYGGALDGLVPAPVERRLREHFGKGKGGGEA